MGSIGSGVKPLVRAAFVRLADTGRDGGRRCSNPPSRTSVMSQDIGDTSNP